MKNLIQLVVLTSITSFLTACGGGSDGNGNDNSSSNSNSNSNSSSASNNITLNNNLSDLYGKLTLEYKFTDSSTIYKDSVIFTAANVNNNIISNVAANSAIKYISCFINPSYSASIPFNYVCLISNPSTTQNNFVGTDMFIFNINNSGQVLGNYEYCTSSLNTCLLSLVSDPDGSVSGSINKSSSALENESPNVDTMDNHLEKLNFKRNKPAATNFNTPEISNSLQINSIVRNFESRNLLNGDQSRPSSHLTLSN